MNFLKTALTAARAAGDIHKKYFHSSLKTKTKSSHFDRVSAADLEAEKAIINIIKNTYPDHGILAEESGINKKSSKYLWIIDPLDGTNNYLHSLPIFSVSIALAVEEQIILGVVFNPVQEELFHAEKNKGAFLNNIAISVSANSNLKSSLLITGFHYARDEKMLQVLEDIRKFFSSGIIGIRRLGSAALDLCYVACGRADGFWEFNLNPWDFAAGKIILEEAGGKTTDAGGKELPIASSYIVGSNTKIHDDMLKVLTST